MYKNVSIVCKKGNKKTYQGLERHLPCLEPLPSVSSLCGITCRDGWKEARYKYWNISIVCIKKTKTKRTLGLETRLEPLLSFQSSCGITRRGGWKEVRYNYRNISIVCKKQKENIPIGSRCGSSPSTRFRPPVVLLIAVVEKKWDLTIEILVLYVKNKKETVPASWAPPLISVVLWHYSLWWLKISGIQDYMIIETLV